MNDEAEPPGIDKALPVIDSFTPYFVQLPNESVDSFLQFRNVILELFVWLLVLLSHSIISVMI